MLRTFYWLLAKEYFKRKHKTGYSIDTNVTSDDQGSCFVEKGHAMGIGSCRHLRSDRFPSVPIRKNSRPVRHFLIR